MRQTHRSFLLVRRFFGLGLLLLSVGIMVVFLVKHQFDVRSKATAPIGARYIDPIFPSYNVTRNVLYGQAQSYQKHTNESLFLDIYQPANDDMFPRRPVLIWVHGGGFISGTKAVYDTAGHNLGSFYAKRGYVVLAIDYRLATQSVKANDLSGYPIVTMAKQDVLAAVRWTKEHAQEYRLDPDSIIVAGHSSGAVAALYAAYDTSNVGGGGTGGVSSDISAVVSISGAMHPTHTQNIQANGPPAIILHGENDKMVPYSFATALDTKLTTLGVPHEFVHYEGEGHDLTGAADMQNRIVAFLYAQVIAKSSAASSQSAAYSNSAQGSNGVKQSLPITGTFIVPDLFYTSEDEYRSFFLELQNNGIHTVIFTLLSELYKDCTTGAYTEKIDSRLSAYTPAFFPIAVRLAKEMNMDMYFTVGQYEYVDCFQYQNGSLNDETSDKGRLIQFSLRALDALQSFLSSQGISWNDPLIAGVYVFPEIDTAQLSDTTSPYFVFIKEFSDAIASRISNKHILYSPYQLEETTYDMSKKAFLNIFNETKVDILAPQDSMGSGFTQSISRSSEHFQALQHARALYTQGYPSVPKFAWGNVETFTTPDMNTLDYYEPAAYDRVQKQIDAITPYVSKTISWIYQHTMLTNPLSDNAVIKNQYTNLYTPEFALKRRALRTAYLTRYGHEDVLSCAQLYYCDTESNQCKTTKSSYYQTSQIQCNTSTLTCRDNLASYLSGKTSGTCYTTLSVCQTECAIPGSALVSDFNHDGTISNTDRLLLLYYWLISDLNHGDINHDGKISAIDYTILMNEWHDLLQK